MSQTLTNIVTALAGQALSFGLAAFFWQYIQDRFKKIEDVDRRIYRLECRDEMRKELGIDACTKPPRPTSPRDIPQ